MYSENQIQSLRKKYHKTLWAHIGLSALSVAAAFLLAYSPLFTPEELIPWLVAAGVGLGLAAAEYAIERALFKRGKRVHRLMSAFFFVILLLLFTLWDAGAFGGYALQLYPLLLGFLFTRPLIPAMGLLRDAGTLRDGAVVMDISGVKGSVCSALADFADVKGWTFIGAHPMAGKEKLGYENSCENLFDGASMILTPFESTERSVVESTSEFLKTLGFSRVVVTDTADHDEMIAYTSQLCHLISSAYVRENLSARHAGYSAGSFRDMVRVGAPDPDTWTELFFVNISRLLPVLDRYINRLARFRDALADDDRSALHADLVEGVEAKKKIDEEKESI